MNRNRVTTVQRLFTTRVLSRTSQRSRYRKASSSAPVTAGAAREREREREREG
ncbi:hypothetical protein JOB18_049069 [Solea senegalensis]|uniref:Uncharacterized protein n=1 Tax=Solea senegalensis TaxID=28829 RepID=A0AAV6PXL7_SOLSE|nr:hypothetical protein JOB18_049069 [Solea senegalensis]